jgi:hypothetical protein
MNKLIEFLDKYFTVFLLWLLNKKDAQIAKLEAEANIVELKHEKEEGEKEYEDLKEDYNDRLAKFRSRVDSDK